MSGRSCRRGRGQQYLPGHGKDPGRRIPMKFMAPEIFHYQRARSGTTQRTKTEITREQGLQALKEQAQAVEAHLRLLENQIRNIEPDSTPSVLAGYVDPEMCVGCGTCQDFCPAGAISVKEIAWIDPKRCIGCGGCVEQCPRGALALHPLKSGYKEQARVAV